MAGQATGDRHTAAICRITEGRQRWRVLVETWSDRDEYRGRLLFQPDARAHPDGTRESSALLQGMTRDDVLSRAFHLPEARLRRVLHSLS